MPEDQVPAGKEEASAETPAPPTLEQISALITAGVKEGIDARIPGLMSSNDKQLSEIKDLVRKSSMDEDEIENERADELSTELAQARRDNEALIAAQQYPEAYPIFRSLMDAENAEAQLKLIDSLRNPPATAPVEESEATEQPESTPPVDPNNPRTDSPTTLEGGVPMNKETAERIFDAIGNVWPGRG